MLKITTRTEILNGLKTIHVSINGAAVRSFHDEYKLSYNKFNLPVRQDIKAIDLASDYILSIYKKVGRSLGEEII
jgi:hypothetical protein